MDKKIIVSCITIICTLFHSFVSAQTDEYFRKMDGIFNIPSHKVTTGLLINRAPNNADVKNYHLQEEIETLLFLWD